VWSVCCRRRFRFSFLAPKPSKPGSVLPFLIPLRSILSFRSKMSTVPLFLSKLPLSLTGSLAHTRRSATNMMEPMASASRLRRNPSAMSNNAEQSPVTPNRPRTGSKNLAEGSFVLSPPSTPGADLHEPSRRRRLLGFVLGLFFLASFLFFLRDELLVQVCRYLQVRRLCTSMRVLLMFIRGTLFKI
jgi:hypothetical protein